MQQEARLISNKMPIITYYRVQICVVPRYQKGGWILPACKPGSVESFNSDGHSSRNAVTCILEQPTRSVLVEVGHLSLPIWPCSRWGLPSHDCYQSRGELLPHHFTLACLLNQHHRRCTFCCTIRRHLTISPRRYLAACPPEPGLSSR